MASQNLVISKKLVVAFSAVLGVVALTSIAIEFAVHHAEDAIETRDASFQLIERLDNAMGAQSDSKGRSATEITIVRRKAGGTVKIAATEDTPVEPDDIVEIAIKFEWLNVAPSN